MGDVSTMPGEAGRGDSQQPGDDIKPAWENMRQHNFRMKQSEWNRLKDHFQSKGLSVAGGVRMILLEYMEKNRVR